MGSLVLRRRSKGERPLQEQLPDQRRFVARVRRRSRIRVLGLAAHDAAGDLGPSAVFRSWQEAESAADRRASTMPWVELLPFQGISGTSPFATSIPASTSSTAAWDWKAISGRRTSRTSRITPHVLRDVSRIDLGEQPFFVEVAALAAEDDWFNIAPEVRQVTIDIGSMTNVSNADLDIVGRLAPDASEDRPGSHPRLRDEGHVLPRLGRVGLRSRLRGALEPRTGQGSFRRPSIPRRPEWPIHDQGEGPLHVPIAYEGTFHSTWTNGTQTRNLSTIAGLSRWEVWTADTL